MDTLTIEEITEMTEEEILKRSALIDIAFQSILMPLFKRIKVKETSEDLERLCK